MRLTVSRTLDLSNAPNAPTQGLVGIKPLNAEGPSLSGTQASGSEQNDDDYSLDCSSGDVDLSLANRAARRYDNTEFIDDEGMVS